MAAQTLTHNSLDTDYMPSSSIPALLSQTPSYPPPSAHSANQSRTLEINPNALLMTITNTSTCYHLNPIPLHPIDRIILHANPTRICSASYGSFARTTSKSWFIGPDLTSNASPKKICTQQPPIPTIKPPPWLLQILHLQAQLHLLLRPSPLEKPLLALW